MNNNRKGTSFIILKYFYVLSDLYLFFCHAGIKPYQQKEIN